MGESQSTPNRSTPLRDARFGRGAKLRFTFDGMPVEACAGESVAAALLAAGIRTLRISPRDAQPRGAFCWMGLCQECTVVIEGIRRPACQVEARHGLTVLTGTIA